MKAKYLIGVGIMVFLAGFVSAGISISANDAVRDFFVVKNISVSEIENKTLEEVVEETGGRLWTMVEYNCAYDSSTYSEFRTCMGSSDIKSKNIILIEEQVVQPPIKQPTINDDRNICDKNDPNPNCEVWR